MSALYVHKCPQDIRWGFCKYDYGDSNEMRRRCMAGCDGRPDHGAHIAAAFLSSNRSPMTPRERWLVEEFPEKYGTDVKLRFTSYAE